MFKMLFRKPIEPIEPIKPIEPFKHHYCIP